MAGRPTEGAVDGGSLTTEYSAQSKNNCDKSESGTEPPKTVAQWLSEWTGEDAQVGRDGSVRVPSDALPLASLDAAQTLKSAGWRFDGFESHAAVYRRCDND